MGSMGSDAAYKTGAIALMTKVKRPILGGGGRGCPGIYGMDGVMSGRDAIDRDASCIVRISKGEER